jgi:regulator of protease activity HflC (stomatin/prohibitin superfamily)
MIKETTLKPVSGYGMLILELLIVSVIVTCIAMQMKELNAAIVILFILFMFFLRGFIIINPNEACVLILFGTYKGTIKESGFHWINPFYLRTRISLRARNLNGESLKVNDKIGNPVEIAAVIVWQVEDTAKSVFEVDDYTKYVNIQSEAAVRHLAGSCPYDNYEEENADITLRGGAAKVNALLENELNERLAPAGIKVIEARISHLAYAQEIAGAMLRRQQAAAVIAARRLIVEGAVGMVEMALTKLSEREIVHLDEERKAAMVSNLLVVLCGDKEVSPIVNTGTLHN